MRSIINDAALTVLFAGPIQLVINYFDHSVSGQAITADQVLLTFAVLFMVSVVPGWRVPRQLRSVSDET